MNNKIIVFGGDGFCGWPTSLYLSRHGYDVTIVDNLSRRSIDNELEAYSLTPIQPMGMRLAAWKETTGKEITFYRFDVAENYFRLLKLIEEVKPHAVVHFAEQRAAPYSMKTDYHKRYTVNNNINATHNILCAVVESGLDVHLVHLGTMGVYGYGTAGMKMPDVVPWLPYAKQVKYNPQRQPCFKYWIRSRSDSHNRPRKPVVQYACGRDEFPSATSILCGLQCQGGCLCSQGLLQSGTAQVY